MKGIRLMKKLYKKVSLLILIMLVISFTTLAMEMPDDYIEETGIAEPDQTYSSGVRAAELIAFRKIAERVGDIPLDEETTVINGRLENEVIKTKLKTTLRRIRVLDEGKRSDGYYYAVVRMPMYGTNSVASVVYDPGKTVEPLPQPKFPQPISTSNDGIYTGLIIDCQGKGLTKAMSPVIKSDDGRSIYGDKNLDYDAIVNKGMASYSTSLTSGVERAGTNPLIIKALKAEGRVNHCNPVISATDADKILSINQSAHFLEKCNVVFVH